MLTNTKNLYATHTTPVWKERANFFVTVLIDQNESIQRWEQLWAEQIESNRFLICCIPFFTWEMDLGDEVETNEDFVFKQVIKKSDYKIHRIWFGNSPGTNASEVAYDLGALGADLEWSSQNLLAIAVSDEKKNTAILDYLRPLHIQEKLVYESVTRADANIIF